jgi:hypothetical protein
MDRGNYDGGHPYSKFNKELGTLRLHIGRNPLIALIPPAHIQGKISPRLRHTQRARGAYL